MKKLIQIIFLLLSCLFFSSFGFSNQKDKNFYFRNSELQVEIKKNVIGVIRIDDLMSGLDQVSFYFNENLVRPFVKIQVGRGLIFTTYDANQNLIFLGIPQNEFGLNYTKQDLINLLLHEFGHAIFESYLNKKGLFSINISEVSPYHDFIVRAYHEFFADFLVVLINQDPAAMTKAIAAFNLNSEGRTFGETGNPLRHLDSAHDAFYLSKSALVTELQESFRSPLILYQIAHILTQFLEQDIKLINQKSNFQVETVLKLLISSDNRIAQTLKEQVIFEN